MGWWKVEGTENVIGDRPLDVLGAAMGEVVALYEDAHKRRPTKAEWEDLLEAILGAEEDDGRVLDKGVVTKVRLEVGKIGR